MKNVTKILAEHGGKITLVLGVIVFSISTCSGYLGYPLNDQTVIRTLLSAVLMILIIATSSLDVLSKRSQEAADKIERRLILVEDSLKVYVLREQEDAVSVEVLSSTYEFYRACNRAREMSMKSMHLMKIHHMGPGDAFADEEIRHKAACINSAAVEEREIWYSGISVWNSAPNRSVERITVTPNGSMRAFIDGVSEQMKGTEYETYILPWDGEQTILNLCVFDRREVIMNFSTRKGEVPYQEKNVKGLRICSNKIAEYFFKYYYEKLTKYCEKTAMDSDDSTS